MHYFSGVDFSSGAFDPPEAAKEFFRANPSDAAEAERRIITSQEEAAGSSIRRAVLDKYPDLVSARSELRSLDTDAANTRQALKRANRVLATMQAVAGSLRDALDAPLGTLGSFDDSSDDDVLRGVVPASDSSQAEVPASDPDVAVSETPETLLKRHSRAMQSAIDAAVVSASASPPVENAQKLGNVIFSRMLAMIREIRSRFEGKEWKESAQAWCVKQVNVYTDFILDHLYPEVFCGEAVALGRYDWKVIGVAVKHAFLLCKRMRKEGINVGGSLAVKLGRFLQRAILGQIDVIVSQVANAVKIDDWSSRKLEVRGRSGKATVTLTSSALVLYSLVQDFMVQVSPAMSRHFATTPEAADAVAQVFQESIAHFVGLVSDELRVMDSEDACLGMVADLFYVGSDLCKRIMEHFQKVSREKLRAVEQIERVVLGNGFTALGIRTYSEKKAQLIMKYLVGREELDIPKFLQDMRIIYDKVKVSLGSIPLSNVVIEDLVDRVVLKLTGVRTNASKPASFTKRNNAKRVIGHLAYDGGDLIDNLDIIIATPGMLRGDDASKPSDVCVAVKDFIQDYFVL